MMVNMPNTIKTIEEFEDEIEEGYNNYSVY